VAVYLDSSALVKLVVAETESDALTGHLRGHPDRVSCAPRGGDPRGSCPWSARDHQGEAAAAADLAGASRRRLLDEAATLNQVNLGSLEAIHLAAARALGQELAEVITYDRRMADAADHIGLPVSAPA